MLFVASEGSKGLLYDLVDKTVLRNYAVNNSGPFSSAYCPASDTVVAHQAKNCSFFLCEHTQQPVHRSFTPEAIVCTTTSRCGTYLVGGTATGSLLVWNLLTGKLVRNFKGHLRSVRCVAFSHAGDLVVSASDDSLCKVWSLAALTNLAASDVTPSGTFTGHTRGVLCCRFFHHTDLVLTGSADRTCRLFDAVTCDCVLTVTLGDSVTAVAVAPDDSRFVAGMESGYLYFSDVATRRREGTSDASLLAAAPPSSPSPHRWSKLRPPSEDTHHSAIVFAEFCSPEHAYSRVLTVSRDGTFLWHDAVSASLIGEAVPKQRPGIISCCAVPKCHIPVSTSRCVGIDKNPVDPTSEDFALQRPVLTSVAGASPSSRKRERPHEDTAPHSEVSAATGVESSTDGALKRVRADNEKLEALLHTLQEKLQKLSDSE